MVGFLFNVNNSKEKISPYIISKWFGIKTEQKKFEVFKEDNFLDDYFLRKSILQEMSFKSLTEYYASKAILDILKIAPNIEEYDFLNTLLVDETNHCFLFRNYLIENNLIEDDEPLKKMALVLDNKHLEVIEPFQKFIEQWVVDKNNFYAGIMIVTIILEGVLAPSAELSEKKWLPFYPRASAIQQYANVDELRHLTLCCDILKNAINKNPKILTQLKKCIVEGLDLWNTSNINNIIMEREYYFQKGIENNIDLIENYQLVDFIKLKDTTPEIRMDISNKMVAELQSSRLNYIGIDL